MYKLTLFWLITGSYTTLVSGIPTTTVIPFNPPIHHDTNKQDSPILDATITIPIRKRGVETLASNGVANVALYQQQLHKSLGKIHTGNKRFLANTGTSITEALAGVSDVVSDVSKDILSPIINPIIGAVEHPAPSTPISQRDNSSNSTQVSSTSDNNQLTDDDDVLWQGTIQVGTPPSTFTVDFDTGSSDLFLPGPNCATCQGHKIFNPKNSSSAVPLKKEFNLAYGDGSTVAGSQYNDTVTLSGVTVPSQTLGVASNYSGFSVDEFPPDGLVGLGFRAISAYPANPLFKNMVDNNLVSSPEFSFKLSDAEGESELTVGGSNPALFDQNSLKWVNVTVPGYWQIVIEAVNVDGKSAASNINGIVDTGTTLLIGDPATVKATYSSILGAKDASQTIGAGFFTYPCNTTSVVSLTFGGAQFNLSQDSFNLGFVSEADQEDCVGGLVASDTGVGWILGDVFLRNTYTIFNFGTQQVGFANLV